MQETLKKIASEKAEPIERSVTVCIRLKNFKLGGTWNWEMHSQALYCSDVMWFPDNFEGTKGLIHPDDLGKLTAVLELLDDNEVLELEFRIITTYGEVKIVRGQQVTIDTGEQLPVDLVPGKEPWDESLRQMALQKEADFLQLRTQLTEHIERMHGLGCWLINKTTGEVWFSDNVFRLHRIAPQSLNTHSNTFNPFIHIEDQATVLDAFERCYTEELPLHIEYRIVVGDQDPVYVQLMTSWLANNKGQKIFIGILRNIQQERELLHQLQSLQSDQSVQQQLMKLSEQQSNMAFWSVNLVTRKASFSENYYRIYGIKYSKLQRPVSLLMQVHPDDREEVSRLFDNMYRLHQFPETEYRIARSDGKLRYVKQVGKVFINSDNELVMLGILRDVTLNQHFEKKLEELNNAFALQKLITEFTDATAKTGVVTWFEDGRVEWSESFLQMLGYRPGSVEMTTRLVHKHIHPADLKEFKEAERRAVEHGEENAVIVGLISKAGTRQVKFHFYQIQETGNSVICVARDVTSEMSLEELLAENKNYTDLLSGSLETVVIYTNTDHTIMSWNTAAENKTGIKKEDALWQNLFDVLPLQQKEGYLGHLHKAISGQEVAVENRQSGYIRKPHHYRLIPFRNEMEEVTGVLHLVEDISKELELQQQLHERLNFVESLVEASVDRIVVLDRHMNYLLWNRKAEEYYGSKKELVLGKNILELFPGFRNDPGYDHFRKALKGATIHIPAAYNEEHNEYSETYLIPVKDEDENVNAVLWIVHDLSREYELQKEKRAADEKIRDLAQKAKDKYLTLFNMIDQGFCTIDMIFDNNGKAVDYRFLEINPAFELQTGLHDAVGKTIRELAPDHEEIWFTIYGEVALTGTARHFEQQAAALGRWYDVYAFLIDNKDEHHVAILFNDITERKKVEMR